MSEQAAASVDVIEILPSEVLTEGHRVDTLIKTPTFEVKRLMLAKGKQIPTHHAPGEITVQCVAGRIAFTAGVNAGQRPGCSAELVFAATSDRQPPCVGRVGERGRAKLTPEGTRLLPEQRVDEVADRAALRRRTLLLLLHAGTLLVLRHLVARDLRLLVGEILVVLRDLCLGVHLGFLARSLLER